MSPRTFFAHRTIERSGSPGSPGCVPSTRNSVPIFEGLRSNQSPQPTEGGRHTSLGRDHNVPFTRPPFPVIEGPAPLEHRRHHAYAEYQIPIIPLNPSSPPPSRNDMLGSTFADVLVFCGPKYDTSPEEEDIFTEQCISSMVNHEGYDVNNMSCCPEFSPTTALYCDNQALEPRRILPNRRAIDCNALVFTGPPLSPTPPLSPPAMPSTPIAVLILKHFCRIFGLAPIQKDRFAHTVATDPPGGQMQIQLDSLRLSSPTHYSFPLQAVMLHELDKLANLNRIRDLPPSSEKAPWKPGTAPASCPHALERLGHLLQRPDKGKGRMIESLDDVDSLVSKQKPKFTTRSRSVDPSTSTLLMHQKPRRYVYDPDLKSTPLFLAGSSTSLVVYRAEGYHSPPRCRSVPNVSPPRPVSSPSGVASFKALFKRPCSDSMLASQTDAFEKDKKTFGWLKI